MNELLDSGYVDGLNHQIEVLEETVKNWRNRCANLEIALRYWMPDETMIPPEHAEAWREHVNQLGFANDRGDKHEG